MVLVWAVLLEAAAYVIFGVQFRERFSFARATQLRQQRVSAASARHPTSKAAAVRPVMEVAHPYVGFVYNPRFDPPGMLAQHSVPVSDWGFLDDKSPLRSAAASEVVVGIFGGSLAFWFSVQGLEAMFAELGKVPEFRGKRFVVVRTPLGGTKQPQQLMTLSYLLVLGGHFDVVINLDGFNEAALAASQVPQGVFPFFPRGWPERLGEAGDPEFSRRVGRVLYLEAATGRWASRFSGPLTRHSVFLTTVWRALDHRLGMELGQARVELDAYKPQVPAERRDYGAVGPRRVYKDLADLHRDLAEFWRQSSLQMHRLCAANGIRYFHFLQPNQYLQGSKPMNEAERKVALWPGSGYEQDVSAVYPLMRAAGRDLAARGVAFDDLTQIFSGVAEPRYVDQCCHVDREGYRLLGRAMGARIAEALRPRN